MTMADVPGKYGANNLPMDTFSGSTGSPGRALSGDVRQIASAHLHVGRDCNRVTLVLISTLVSAVSLCLEPGVNNWRRFGSEPRLLKPYWILFAIRQTNKIMRLPE